ncbi:MAG: protein kinase [Pirellulaceae bacterium]|nr:protein kinase [Pirellulaceae bacterium]
MEHDDQLREPDDTDRQAETQGLGTVGNYELVRLLGMGGAGKVYEARHVQHGSRVALKRLLNLSPASVAAFRQEFRSLQGISHRNLVKLLELDAQAADPYFVMELVEGEDFLSFVRAGFDSQDDDARPCCDPGHLTSALRQVVEGLLALHGARKLHRDIKPRNVLVTRDGRVVLLDFGLAVDLERDAARFRNSLHERSGTPCYMSPEQHSAQPLSVSSDWYSVGVMLFEALTGRVPFEGRTLDELVAQKMAPDRPAPRDLAPEVPDELNQLCVDLLAPEPDARPSGEQILARLGVEVTIPAAHREQRVWVGRDDALGQLSAALNRVRVDREPVAVLVSGPPGAGKSALVSHFLDSLGTEPRCVVFRGRCRENESVPYKGFDMVVDALARFLRRLPMSKAEGLLARDKVALRRQFPVLETIPAVQYAQGLPESARQDAHEMRRQGLAALCETLGRLSDRETMIIHVDDLQWGDAETAAVFEELARRSNRVRCLLLGAFRSGEEARESACVQAIRKLVGSDYALQVSVDLGALNAVEAEQLAARLISDQSPGAAADARLIAEESRGNPLFVEILARHRDAARAARATSGRLSLEEVLWKLIVALPPAQRTVLELAAVAGRPVARQLIRDAAGSPVDFILILHDLLNDRYLRALRRAGGDDIETYHDRIRETILNRLEPTELSRRAAQLVEVAEAAREPFEPEFMARLLEFAGRHADAGRYYWQAADRAREQLAFGQAVALYQNAELMLRPEGDEQLELRMRLAEALALAGRGKDAADQYLAASESSQGKQRLDLLCHAARRYLTSGHVEQGLSALDQVLFAVGMPRPRFPLMAYAKSYGWRTRFWWNGLRFRTGSVASLPERQRRMLEYSWAAAAGLSVVDPIRAGAYVSRNVALSLRAGDLACLTRSLTAQVGHIAAEGQGRRREIKRFLLALGRVAERPQLKPSARDPYSQAGCYLARGVAAHLQGRWRAASRCCDRAAKYLCDKRCQDVAWELDTARTFALWALYYQGRIAELARRQPELLRMARDQEDLFATLNFGSIVMTLVQLGADRPDVARRQLEVESGMLSSDQFYVQHHNWVLGRTLLELYEGQLRAAWDAVANQWTHYQRAWLNRVEQVRLDFYQVQGRAAVAVAADPQADVGQRPAWRTVRTLEAERAPWAKAIASLLRGGLATIRNDRQVAVDKFERAVELLEAQQMHLHAAAARCRLGQLRADQRGREHAARGRERMAELGATNVEKMTRAMAPGKFT